MNTAKLIVSGITICFCLYLSYKRMRAAGAWMFKVFLGLMAAVLVIGGLMAALAFSSLPDTHPHVFAALLYGGAALFVVGLLFMRSWMLKQMRARAIPMVEES